MNIEMKVCGEYNLVITRADGTITETGWFDNLILDLGLDYMGTGTMDQSGNTFNPPMVANCQVGTGSSTPLVTQTGLDARVAGTSFNGFNTPYANTPRTVSPYEFLTTFTFPFAQGAVVGDITEVGVGPSGTASTLFSRALILDNGGSPTTVSLISIDQLTVYYRIKLYTPLTDFTGSVIISGDTYNYTGRQAGATNGGNMSWHLCGYIVSSYGITAYAAGSTLGAITGYPTGAQALLGNTGTVTYSAYVPGTHYRDFTVSGGTTGGNVAGGIQALLIRTIGDALQYQYILDTPIPKDNTKTLAITVRVSWSRI